MADICRRLDGLPLAIELAAARVRLLGVQGLRDRLGERFRVLTGGARTALRRHQTLRSALDWSHALLSRTEQVVLRRLGVFVGGFALELAQAVARDGTFNGTFNGTSHRPLDEWAVLDTLAALVDKSLVIADATEPPRYRLLETTRAYALEKLAAAGETDAWIARHARALCAFFERVEEGRRGEQATLSNMDFVRQLAPELDNARAALAWAGGTTLTRGDLNLAVGLAGPLAQLQMSLGLAAEAKDTLTALQHRLDASVDPARAALLWYCLASLGLSARRPMAQSLDAVARAEAFYRRVNRPLLLALVLTLKAQLLALAGDAAAAQELLDEVCRLQQAARPESPVRAAWVGGRLAAQGWVHMMQGQLEQALAVHQEQRALLLQAPGERRGLIFSESNVCRDLYLLDRHDECMALAQAVIEREGGANSGTTGVIILLLMMAQLASGRLAQAGQTLSAALPGWRRDGTVRTACGVVAVWMAEQGRWADAARLGGAALAHQRLGQFESFPSRKRLRERLQWLLQAAPCSRADTLRWHAEGETLNEAAIEAICLRALRSVA